MSVRKSIMLMALIFAALVALTDGYILPSLKASEKTQTPCTFTCEIRKTDEGWKIIPNTQYKNDWYWKNVCHCDITFKDKEDAIHTLEIARWKMLPPSPADGNTIRFSITDDFTASPQAIDRWEKFLNGYNPEEHK
jgi:hypothetical protein